jgi:hypothetical protein
MSDDWNGLPRFSKLSSVLYPQQVSKERLAQMEALARREGKNLKGPALLSDQERGAVSQLGGVAVSSAEKGKKDERKR